MANIGPKNLFLDLLVEVESLSIHVVEDWLEPDKIRENLVGIRTFYEEKFYMMNNSEDFPERITKIFQECLDELLELEQLIMQEQSVPDVVQEYLTYMVGDFRKKIS